MIVFKCCRADVGRHTLAPFLSSILNTVLCCKLLDIWFFRTFIVPLTLLLLSSSPLLPQIWPVMTPSPSASTEGNISAGTAMGTSPLRWPCRRRGGSHGQLTLHAAAISQRPCPGQPFHAGSPLQITLPAIPNRLYDAFLHLTNRSTHSFRWEVKISCCGLRMRNGTFPRCFLRNGVLNWPTTRRGGKITRHAILSDLCEEKFNAPRGPSPFSTCRSSMFPPQESCSRPEETTL